MSLPRFCAAELVLVIVWQALCRDDLASSARVDVTPGKGTDQTQEQQRAREELAESLKEARADLAKYAEQAKQFAARVKAQQEEVVKLHDMLTKARKEKDKAQSLQFEVQQKYIELKGEYETLQARLNQAKSLPPLGGPRPDVKPLHWTLRRTSKPTNVEDEEGRWEYSGGEVRDGDTLIGYYSAVVRVSSVNPLNAGGVRVTLFLKGDDPPQNMVFEGACSLSSGNHAGSVAATSEAYAKYLGLSYRLTDGQLTIPRKRPSKEPNKAEGARD